MKKSKQMLAFEQLEVEMEMICQEQMHSFKGGDGSTGVGWSYGMDQYGNLYIRDSYSSGGWVPFNGVTITGYSSGSNPYNWGSGPTGFDYDQYQYVFNPNTSGHYTSGGGGGVGAATTDVVRTNFIGGYIETMTLNHLDGYNFMDGMQAGLTYAGIVVTAAGLQSLSTAGTSLLGAMMTLQGLQWADIETKYMNTGYNEGIIIEKMTMTTSSMPTPYSTYTIKDTKGNTLGSASGPGW